MSVRIFLSAVSDEFRAYRDQLRSDLTRHNVEVKVQEDFKDCGALTLEKLDNYITNCDAVVHLVGDMTGVNAGPHSVQAIRTKYPDLTDKLPPLGTALDEGTGISYTQWEAWLALNHGKALLIAQADDSAPRGPAYAPTDVSRAAQQAHLARLRAVERYPGQPFTNPDSLAQHIFSSVILDLLVKEQRSGLKLRFALSNVPIRVPRLFMGRDDALAAVEVALQRYKGRVSITALHGLRGVGKTTLAAAYAERHRSRYRATWWIRARTAPTLRADFIALGLRLGWVGANLKEEPALAVTLERLQDEGEGILLIFDNAIDANSLRPFLPRAGVAHVLITSTARTFGGVAEPIELRIWPSRVGAEYLTARTDQHNEPAAAEALSETLGGLPLAHEQAAAYCERLGISLAEYRTRFEATPARILDAQNDAPAEFHDGLTVAKAFALAIEEAAKLHPAAEPLIAYTALLAPEPIPLFLFSETRELLDEPVASMLADMGLDEAIAALRTFALIDRETIQDERDAAITTECIRLHRLVRQVAAARQEGEARSDIFRALVEMLVAVYPEDVQNDLRSWPRARRLDALTLALVSENEAPLPGTEAQTAYLLNQLATYRFAALAAYAQARLLYERALAIREGMLGPRDLSTAASLNNLAGLLQDQGDLAGARPLYERALSIWEEALGPNDPTTATSLNNLAGLLRAQGDLAGARPLFERALAIRKTKLGPDHPETAASLNNLARLIQDEGDLAGAQPLFECALVAFEAALGPDHPTTATSLNNLANLLQARGDLVGARPLLVRALAIREKVLGPDHPETATSLNNLAVLLKAEGDLAGARPLFERALDIRGTALGPDHPETAVSRSNLTALQ